MKLALFVAVAATAMLTLALAGWALQGARRVAR
jgi:hypothetical protein